MSLTGFSEYDYTANLAGITAELLRAAGHEVVVTNRSAAGSTSPSGSARAANETGADIAFELHFNAEGTGRGSGAEVLHWPLSSVSRQLAAVWLDSWCALTGFRKRRTLACIADDLARKHGVRTYTNRGESAVRKSVMPFFICELFFGSSKSDLKKEQNLHADLPGLLAASIIETVKAYVQKTGE